MTAGTEGLLNRSIGRPPDVANGGSSVAGWQHGVNQPILKNPDGSMSTERTVTVPHPSKPGKWMIIPSLWGGKQLDEESAARMAMTSGRDFPEFNSIDEADAWAEKHSPRIGGLLDFNFDGQYQMSPEQNRMMNEYPR